MCQIAYRIYYETAFNPTIDNIKVLKKSNLKKVTAAQHNKLHPEKGRKAAAARKRKGTKRKTTRRKK